MGSRDLLSQLSRLGELGQIALAQFLEVRQRRHDEISECTDGRMDVATTLMLLLMPMMMDGELLRSDCDRGGCAEREQQQE